MDDYRIRPAVEADIPAIVPMRVKLIRHICEQNPRVWRSTDKRLAELPDKYREYLEDADTRVTVAEHTPSAELAGWCTGSVIRTEDFEPHVSGRIDGVWIEPAHRRHGLCARFVAELVAWWRELGIARVSLWHSAQSPEAEATWRHFGFEPVFHIASTSLDTLAGRVEQ